MSVIFAPPIPTPRRHVMGMALGLHADLASLFSLLAEYHQMQNHGEDAEVPAEAKSSDQRIIFINQAQPRKYTHNRIW